MKVLTFLFILLFLLIQLIANDLKVLPELMNPKNIIVDDDQIYISDYPFVFIYSKESLQLIKKIGGQGEGPGEFYIDKMWLTRKLLGLVISKKDHSLFIDSMGRLTEYEMNGTYNRVIKKNPFKGGNWFYVLAGGRFVGFDRIREKDYTIYNSINLYDKNLKKLKMLFKALAFNKSGNYKKESSNFFKKIAMGINYKVYGNKIFACNRGEQQLKIYIYNHEGVKINEVKKEIEGIKLSKEFENRAKKYYRVKYKLGLEFNLKNTFFPDYFPAIHDFAVSNHKIYVFTYKREGEKNQVLIFNEQGDLLKEDLVRLKEKNPEYFSPFFILDEDIYQLIEDEDAEQWFLKRISISQ